MIWPKNCTHIKADQIVHVPRILYHWRIHPESTAGDPNSKDYTSERGLKAVQHYLDEQQKTSGCQQQPQNGHRTGTDATGTCHNNHLGRPHHPNPRSRRNP